MLTYNLKLYFCEVILTTTLSPTNNHCKYVKHKAKDNTCMDVNKGEADSINN